MGSFLQVIIFKKNRKALKQFRNVTVNDKEKKLIERQLSILSNAKNENVIRYVEWYFEPTIIGDIYFLITEFYEVIINKETLIISTNFFWHIRVTICINKIIKGGTLEEAIAHKLFCGTKFTEEYLISWTYKLLSALDYLHNELKIIHRDIKPGYKINILSISGKSFNVF